MSAMSLTKAPIPNRLGVGIQQVRHLKRRPAYPQAYKPKLAPLSHPKKDHSSFFQRHMKEWLGPKNMRGEYYRNKYYYPSQDHKPRYIVPDGNTVVEDGKVDVYDNRKVGSDKRDPSLHPFPFNPYCKTASVIPLSLKDKIYEEVVEKGAHVQEVAYRYGIKIPRVEAIIKLREVENSWEQKNLITEELQRFSDVMYRMFPLYEPPVQAENLTEIPTPHKTLHQRFLTISESEPFGPVDAAKVFDLKPAQDILNDLTELKHDDNTESSHKEDLVIGKQLEGDRSLFKFTKSKSGEVGFRYGASRRDRKKDRKVGFDRNGSMVYI